MKPLTLQDLIRIRRRLKAGLTAAVRHLRTHALFWSTGVLQVFALIWAVTSYLDASRAGAPQSLCPEWLGCVELPGGTLLMGSDDGDSNEKTVHEVRVPPFALMRAEVTNAQYRKCVEEGACSAPRWEDCIRRSSKETTEFQEDEQPVVCVTWDESRTFARWAGGRLPSEAEWELAARGAGDFPRKYPWGEEPPDCERAIFDPGNSNGCGRDSTWPVCSKPGGNTPEGICDLAGNVWEWVEDCWHNNYDGAPVDGSAWVEDCSGGSDRVVRGGSWVYVSRWLRGADRDWWGPTVRDDSQGFRVAFPSPTALEGSE